MRKRKNHRRVCNNNIMLTVCFIIIFAFGLFFGMRFVQADESVQYEKSFVSIELQNGDTLTSIARQYAISEAEYQDYIEEVKSINNLDNDVIHSGCYLLVPVYERIDSQWLSK